MKITKIAKSYKTKLSLASDNLSEDLRKIMGYASNLANGYEIYDDAYDAAQRLASSAYNVWKMSQSPDHVIPASVVSGWLETLKNSVSALAKNVKDQGGLSKLQALNGMLAGVQPMDIGPAQQKEPGSAYTQEPETSSGADEDKLRDVVKDMAPKPNPWDAEALEPWKVDTK